MLNSPNRTRKQIFYTILFTCTALITFCIPPRTLNSFDEQAVFLQKELSNPYIENEYVPNYMMYVITTVVISYLYLLNRVNKINSYSLYILYLKYTVILYTVINILKVSVSKMRPDFQNRITLRNMSILSEGLTSFPSGHAATAFYVFSFVFYTGILGFKSNLKYLMVLLSIPAVLVSYSRYLDNKHFPIDIICGGLIGFFIFILSICCEKEEGYAVINNLK